MLHQGQGGLEQRCSDHFVVTGCLQLHMHHDCRICHCSGKILIVCVHIRYPLDNHMLECVLDNVLEAFEYVVMCENTHGINILAI